MSFLSMDKYFRVYEDIISMLKCSSNEEDLVHSGATVYWLLQLERSADINLLLAARGSDLERASVSTRINPENYSDYEGYVKASNKQSADVLRNVMRKNDCEEEYIEDVCELICNHDVGKCVRSKLLRDADALSFIHMSTPFYHDSESGVLESRCKFEYERMSSDAQNLLRKVGLYFHHKRLNKIMESLLGTSILDDMEKAATKYVEEQYGRVICEGSITEPS